MFNEKEYKRKYYIKNKEREKKRNKRYYIDHKEEIKKHVTEWQSNNPEKVRMWREENRKKLLKYNIKYRVKNRKEILKRERGFYQNNHEKMLTQAKQYREANPEYQKKYREKNRERINIVSYKWNKTDKGKANVQRGRTKRRAREREIINTLTSGEWLNILEQYDYRCVYCGVEFDCENLPTKDHVIPISKGGHNTKENIVPNCKSCNCKKHDKILKREAMLCR